MTLGKSGQKHFKTHIISLSITSIKSLMSLSSNLMTNNLIGLIYRKYVPYVTKIQILAILSIELL